MKRLLPVVAWIAVVVLLGLVIVRDPELGRRRGDAQRLRVVDLEAPVTFPLDAHEERVKLVTWVARPQSWARDVRATLPYALEYAVIDRDEKVVQADRIWFRTRQSWLSDDDGTLLRPTWLAQARDEVSDSRTVELDLRGLLPAGGRLQLRGMDHPSGTRVLGVAFRHAPRTRAARLRFLAGGSPLHNESQAARITSRGWAGLSLPWRSRLANRVWERLSPLPAAGQSSIPTIELMHAPVEEPWEGQAALGMPIPPGGAVALNLEPGAILRGRWRDAAGRRAGPAPTWVQRVSPDGTTELRFLGVVEEIGPLVARGPLESIHLALDPSVEGARLLQLHLDEGPGARDQDGAGVWGDPPRARDPAGGWRIAPDLRTLEMVRVDAGLNPVRFAIEDPEETLRLTLRPRLSGAPLPAFGLQWDALTNRTVELPPPLEPSVGVELRALDADGVELARWETAVRGRPSIFERYTQGDDPGSARCSEPEQRYLVPPEGAAVLEVRSDRPLDLALRARHPDHPPARVSRGYAAPAALAGPPPDEDSPLPTWKARGEHPSVDLPLARYEPYAQDAWRARSPLDIEELLAEGRLVRIDAQVRLEPASLWETSAWLSRGLPTGGDEPLVDDDGLPPSRGAVALGGPYTLIAEPDRDGSARRGARTRLSRSDAVVEVPKSGRLDVDYRVDVELAGAEASLRVDGKDHPQRLLATAGRLRVAGLEPGPHTVSVDQPGLFLARARGRPSWQVRKVVRLDPGRARSIPLPARAGSIAIYAYGSGGWIDWSLRGGQATPGPSLLEKSTRRVGRHALLNEGASAWPVSRAGSLMARLRPLVVFLYDDVAAAPSTLQLELTGTDEPVWIRAAASWEACVGAGCGSGEATRTRVAAP